MHLIDPSLIFWSSAAIQVLGLVSAWLARVSEGSVLQSPCQWMFFGCLLSLGMAIMASLAIGPGAWLLPGATLSLMVIVVVWDFGLGRKPATA